MKKALVFLMMCLSSLISLANHYEPVESQYNMSNTFIIQINGEEQYSANFEVGAFCGTECRGSQMAIEFFYNHRYLVQMQIYGDFGDSFTFKLYDHGEGKELDYLVSPEAIEYATNGYGTVGNPYALNFTGSESTTFPLPITGYGELSNSGGYYLISSPIGNVATSEVENLTTGTYDLYSFDQAAEMEWINMHDGGTLEAGKGYLYANSTDVTLTFTGTAYTGTGTFDLEYSEANPAEEMRGWNLVGNPFATEATVNRDFYVMNDGGSEIIAGQGNIAAMQGIFVKAEAIDESVTFTQSGNSDGSSLALNLVRTDRSAGLIDRAIVRFDNGGTLPKFMLDENNTKVYIPNDGKDFAVVNRGTDNTMPVSFKAREDGSYTLKTETTNLELGYLHLVDNLTGTDVDLLATPSYTFEARTTDHANRFTLVFGNATGIEEGTPFAYYNGNDWEVSNTGDATLQVMDMTGRVLGTKTLNGNATISLNQPAGIYMLRLVNGNDVKVQKIIIK